MITDGAGRLPDWKDLYQLAILEQNHEKLLGRITEARKLILDRIQETISTPSHYTERQELSDALNGLRVLNQEYLSQAEQHSRLRQRMG